MLRALDLPRAAGPQKKDGRTFALSALFAAPDFAQMRCTARAFVSFGTCRTEEL